MLADKRMYQGTSSIPVQWFWRAKSDSHKILTSTEIHSRALIIEETTVPAIAQ